MAKDNSDLATTFHTRDMTGDLSTMDTVPDVTRELSEPLDLSLGVLGGSLKYQTVDEGSSIETFDDVAIVPDLFLKKPDEIIETKAAIENAKTTSIQSFPGAQTDSPD